MYTTSLSLLDQLRYNRGAKQHWERFVELYTPLLHYWAFRLPRMQEADNVDLIQDVFLTLLTKLPAFQPKHGQTFRAWLRKLLVNRWSDRLRRMETERTLPGESVEQLVCPDDLDEVVAADYRRFVVGRALQLMQSDFELPTWQACWQVVALERPVADVARELGMSPAAVYIAKSRVMRKLRQELEGLLDE
jgi:RNA polymerase sigma-70 factor, ECF subfamily